MTETKGITRKAALLSSAATLTAGLILGAAPFALAQQQGDNPDQAEEEEIEQIVVTGSRIVRPELTSPSPLTVVGAEDFQVTGTINTEALLNQLPQVIPGVTQFSNNPGGGVATVDLRGLGSVRTLVLVNGRRVVPSDPLGFVDLNNIPAPLIKRVETITGGASAVYGSDAISGVVNFILKDDFEGAEINAMYRVTSRGDSAVKTASLTVGGNFADGRG
ncbi:MAG: TonB-dependent receptor, partial [Alphaproteobacteria bacterium]